MGVDVTDHLLCGRSSLTRRKPTSSAGSRWPPQLVIVPLILGTSRGSGLTHSANATPTSAFTADSAEAGSMSSDPAALRRDIEEVRGELTNTVEALAAKADVKSWAQEKVQEL